MSSDLILFDLGRVHNHKSFCHQVDEQGASTSETQTACFVWADFQ